MQDHEERENRSEDKQQEIISTKEADVYEGMPVPEEKFRDKFKRFLRNKIVIAIASIVFGILLVMWQRQAVDFIIWVLGLILVVCAVIFALMFVFKKEKIPGLIVAAILMAIFGAFFLIKPDAIVVVFPFIMGIILVLSGLLDVGNALSLPKGAKGKTGVVIVSLLIVALGVLCMFHPGFMADVMILCIGLFFLFNGVFDLIVLILNSGRQEQQS